MDRYHYGAAKRLRTSNSPLYFSYFGAFPTEQSREKNGEEESVEMREASQNLSPGDIPHQDAGITVRPVPMWPGRASERSRLAPTPPPLAFAAVSTVNRNANDVSPIEIPETPEHTPPGGIPLVQGSMQESDFGKALARFFGLAACLILCWVSCLLISFLMIPLEAWQDAELVGPNTDAQWWFGVAVPAIVGLILLGYMIKGEEEDSVHLVIAILRSVVVQLTVLYGYFRVWRTDFLIIFIMLFAILFFSGSYIGFVGYKNFRELRIPSVFFLSLQGVVISIVRMASAESIPVLGVFFIWLPTILLLLLWSIFGSVFNRWRIRPDQYMAFRMCFSILVILFILTLADVQLNPTRNRLIFLLVILCITPCIGIMFLGITFFTGEREISLQVGRYLYAKPLPEQRWTKFRPFKQSSSTIPYLHSNYLGPLS